MLIQYNHITELSEAEKLRLKSFITGMNITGPVMFEGKTLNPAELSVQQRIWENKSAGREFLLG